MRLHIHAACPARQRGAAMIIITIAMLALLMVAGLALDTGHMLLNKTRLQNAADAAALAAAKELDNSGSTVLATQEALAAFNNNAQASGNGELGDAYAAGDINVQVEFSTTLPPFTPGSLTGPYVRVRATGYTLPAWLVSVGGVTEKTVAASAVAGPRTLNVGSTVCNLAPMMVCGDAAAGAGGLFGYSLNAPVVLKKSTPGGQSQVGPGNFQLVQLGGSGANIVRENMAGTFNACLAGGSTIQTQTGNEAGPVAQGLNTRFGEYDGPMNGTQAQYPPDVIVDAQSPPLTAQQNASNGFDVYQGNTPITSSNIEQLYNYQDYENDLTNPSSYDHQPVEDGGIGAFGRRIVAVPVGNCTGTVNGQGSVPLLGFACFFLLQPAVQKGNDSFVFGQFIEGCNVTGTPGPNPVAGNGPHIIQLYRNPGSTDS
jgi:Flp pilus assembly protein TadG